MDTPCEKTGHKKEINPAVREGTILRTLFLQIPVVLKKAIIDYSASEVVCDFTYDAFLKIIGLGLPAYNYHLKPDDYPLALTHPRNITRTIRVSRHSE